MNREQARQALLAYRPDSADASDPDVRAALRFAQDDPELSSWLEEQTSFHRSLASELRQLPVPPGLKARILAERPGVIVPLWQRREWLLLAACLGLGLIVAALWTRPPGRAEETFAGFRTRMIGNALRVYRMDIITNDAAVVRSFLASQGSPADYTLTAGLDRTPVKGGARLSWQGHPVSMVCFQLPKAQTLFMFVVNEADIRAGAVPGSVPQVVPMHGVATASWRRDGKVYFIAAPTDSEELKKYLEG